MNANGLLINFGGLQRFRLECKTNYTRGKMPFTTAHTQYSHLVGQLQVQ